MIPLETACWRVRYRIREMIMRNCVCDATSNETESTSELT